MAEQKRWFKDFPTEIKNGATSDDYLEHKLRLMNLGDIDDDIDTEALRLKRNVDLFYESGGEMGNEGMTYRFKLRGTEIHVVFDDWYNVCEYAIKETIPECSDTYDAKIICSYIEAIVKEKAPDEARKEVEQMWKDVDNRHVVRGTAIAIQRINEVPTMLSIALGGKKLEDVDTEGGSP